MKTKPDQSNVPAIGQMLRNALSWKAEQEAQEPATIEERVIEWQDVQNKACPDCGSMQLVLHGNQRVCGCIHCKGVFRWPSLKAVKVSA